MDENEDDFLSDTRIALTPDLLKQIQDSCFCIVGCGGVGSLFAEMLVRTGANDICLIDGDYVARDNLNRTPAFIERDVGDANEKIKKVCALKARLESIVATDINLKIKIIPLHFRDDNEEGILYVQRSSFTVVAMNNPSDRKLCEDICWESERRFVSIGIRTECDGKAYYECIWRSRPRKSINDEGGYGHGSYASIVMEATAVGFNMLLSHMRNPNCGNDIITKKYDKFVPV